MQILQALVQWIRRSLADRQRVVVFWLPGVCAGGLAWAAFTLVGDTPLLRGAGLALTIIGVALTLRRLGAALAVIGSLALAFSPAFWSQTGGGASVGPATTVLALMIAVSAFGLITLLSQRPYLALGLGALVFALIFWSQIGTPRSLRLTGLLSAWTVFLLVDALITSNPRPDEAQPAPIEAQHTFGLLILLFVGVLNDPLFVLLAPAVVIGLWLSWTPLPRWYWVALAAAVIIGVRGLAVTYVELQWWRSTAQEAAALGNSVPYMIEGGWRDGTRWIALIALIVRQFTPVGAVLSVIGLARLARWYPVLGVVSMIAYGFYVLFGLMYFGPDREILLMPMFIVQILWLTYAVYTFGQWLERSLRSSLQRAHWLATSAFGLLPVYLLLLVLRTA